MLNFLFTKFRVFINLDLLSTTVTGPHLNRVQYIKAERRKKQPLSDISDTMRAATAVNGLEGEGHSA
jgi:hypothetical protein